MSEQEQPEGSQEIDIAPPDFDTASRYTTFGKSIRRLDWWCRRSALLNIEGLWSFHANAVEDGYCALATGLHQRAPVDGENIQRYVAMFLCNYEDLPPLRSPFLRVLSSLISEDADAEKEVAAAPLYMSSGRLTVAGKLEKVSLNFPRTFMSLKNITTYLEAMAKFWVKDCHSRHLGSGHDYLLLPVDAVKFRVLRVLDEFVRIARMFSNVRSCRVTGAVIADHEFYGRAPISISLAVLPWEVLSYVSAGFAQSSLYLRGVCNDALPFCFIAARLDRAIKYHRRLCRAYARSLGRCGIRPFGVWHPTRLLKSERAVLIHRALRCAELLEASGLRITRYLHQASVETRNMIDRPYSDYETMAMIQHLLNVSFREAVEDEGYIVINRAALEKVINLPV